MKHFLFVFALAAGGLALATDTAEDLHIRESGQLFVVRAIPGQKLTQIFVAGHKAGEIQFQKLRVKGRYTLNGKSRDLPLIRENDHFVTTENLAGRSVQLDIQDEGTQKGENINLDFSKKPKR